DVMSYSDTNRYFASQKFPVTDWNQTNDGLKLEDDGAEHPKYKGPDGLITVTSQNSFTYLQYVLGGAPGAGKLLVAHSSSPNGAGDPAASGYEVLDPSLRTGYIPQSNNLSLNTLVDGTLS